MKVFKEIYDASDLRDWAVNQGWCLDGSIERLDETDNWDLAYSYIEDMELSETQLNDFLRFDIDDILDEEEESEEERVERLLLNVLLEEENE